MGFIEALTSFFTKVFTVKNASVVLLSFLTSSFLALPIEILNRSDYVSIGDNIYKLYGSKPKMFSVVENALAIIIKKLMTNIEGNSFNLKEKDNEKDNPDSNN